MNLLARLQMFFNVKTANALDRLEDPRETLEYAYQGQLDMLRRVKQGLIEVATSRRQLEGQSKKLRQRVPLFEDQARRALAAGREDLARIALQRKQTALGELERLDRQAAEVAAEEARLTAAQQQFVIRLDTFRARRESLTARFTAAEAQVRIAESLSGVSAESAEMGITLERAEEKIERMVARASAIDALIENGALSVPAGEDPIERELREIASSQAVEEALAALKAQMAAGPAAEPGGPPSQPASGDETTRNA
jgi:phage shock protein A